LTEEVTDKVGEADEQQFGTLSMPVGHTAAGSAVVDSHNHRVAFLKRPVVLWRCLSLDQGPSPRNARLKCQSILRCYKNLFPVPAIFLHWQTCVLIWICH
jgi:hypothetical protein